MSFIVVKFDGLSSCHGGGVVQATTHNKRRRRE